MTNPRTIQPDARKVIVGVDTHTHVHVAVAIDTWGIRFGDRSCAADSDGYQQLITWAERHGRVAAFGIEGTGSDGAGLARAVRRAGHQVLEVNRGDRRTRRIAGKFDPVDAETAARSVLAGQSTAIPKTADGAVEMMRHLKVARRTAVNARTSAMITRKPIVVTAPPALREPLHPLADQALLKTMPRMAVRHDRYADRLGETYPPGARPSLVRSLRRDRGPRPSPGSTHNPDLADVA